MNPGGWGGGAGQGPAVNSHEDRLPRPRDDTDIQKVPPEGIKKRISQLDPGPLAEANRVLPGQDLPQEASTGQHLGSSGPFPALLRRPTGMRPVGNDTS